ncbi:Electron transfer DM13 [Popillia japonica]|uniref:Electron transfer DM13 n=1 Tax=Popillia japonica TaxID=7064 RepID=A0AAW1KND0_POPJA
MRKLCSFTLLLLAVSLFAVVFCQEDEGPYKGKYIGKFNTYDHQVSGDVYAVDEYTLLLSKFTYSGDGKDTFFWAGSVNRPGPQGFIIPDEHGVTNVLERYVNKEFTLNLPDNKKITDLKWFAVYDIRSQNTFGDIYIVDEFEPPKVQSVPKLEGKSNNVNSESIEIIDAKTLRIPKFEYDGLGKRVHFWVGVGPQPASKGHVVPDEYGYVDPLRKYTGQTVILELPGDLTIFNIDWFSVYDLETNTNFGSIFIPEGLNVPPSLVKIIPYTNDVPNCLQLHKYFQVSWEIFGAQITIQLAGQVREDEYISFGISGSEERSQMLGSDVTVAYMNGYSGYALDYNITALTPCVKVLGQNKGVCRDELVGGQDNNQFISGSRKDGINVITYRRSLSSSDDGDKEFATDREIYIVWAMGRLDSQNEPSFHDTYSKANIKVNLSTAEPINTCFSFTTTNTISIDAWEKGQIYDRTIRVFHAYVGPSGGKKGYQATTGQASTTLAWYINAPELWLRRGLTYQFKVKGGNNPHSAEFYHPLIITDEPHGGYDKLTDAAQSNVRVLAGVEYSRRGRPRPTAAGPLCLAKHADNQDRRLDDDFATFKKFNRSLIYSCEEGEPGILEVTPNTTWPDTVYYNSFTQANMGYKIHIVDSFNRHASTAHGIIPSVFNIVVVLFLVI